MPKLPSDQDLGVVSAEPGGRIASVSNAGAAGEAMAQLGANVVQLGSTVLDVHDENAQAQADSAVWRGKIALDQKYKNDPDPSTAPQRYNDELTGLVNQSASSIIQPRVKTQFLDMTNRYVVARGVEMIQNASDAALTNQAVAKLRDDADAGVNAFAVANDQRDQFGILQSFKGQVDAMVKSRTLSATDGDTLYKNFVQRAAYAHIVSGGTPEEITRRANEFMGVEAPAAGAAPVAGQTPAPDLRAAIIKGESGGNVAAVNPKTGAAGRYQMLPSTAAQYGLTAADLTNPDPKVQAKVDVAFNQFTADNTKALTASLGRPPTPAELTLAHQQGAQGAASLLLNPDTPAVNMVGRDAVLGNGGSLTMSSADFTAHVENYYGAGTQPTAANTNTPTTPDLVQQPRPGSMASRLPADELDKMMTGITTQLNVAQGRIDHQQAQAIKVQEDNAKTAITTYQRTMEAQALDPKQPGIDWTAVNNDPRLANDPSALPALMAFQRSLDKPPPSDDGVDKQTTAQLYRGYLNGTATTKDFQEAFAPTDGSPGKISKANLDFLMNSAKTENTPENDVTKALKAKFLASEGNQITHDPTTGEDLDKTAPGASQMVHDSEYRFTIAFSNAWDAKVKAGEDPTVLVNPDSKEYFATKARMSSYVMSADDWMKKVAADQAAAGGATASSGGMFDWLFGSSTAAQPAATAPKVYKTQADLQGAINSGEMSLPDAQAYGLAHGILGKKQAPAAAPVLPPAAPVNLGPQVPTGQ